MAAQVDQGTSRTRYETGLANVIRRRGGIGNVLKTLGIAKVEPSVHVSTLFPFPVRAEKTRQDGAFHPYCILQQNREENRQHTHKHLMYTAIWRFDRGRGRC